jgi:hypothetical protein
MNQLHNKSDSTQGGDAWRWLLAGGITDGLPKDRPAQRVLLSTSLVIQPIP